MSLVRLISEAMESVRSASRQLVARVRSEAVTGNASGEIPPPRRYVTKHTEAAMDTIPCVACDGEATTTRRIALAHHMLDVDVCAKCERRPLLASLIEDAIAAGHIVANDEVYG